MISTAPKKKRWDLILTNRTVYAQHYVVVISDSTSALSHTIMACSTMLLLMIKARKRLDDISPL
jgi:hypothetical protein